MVPFTICRFFASSQIDEDGTYVMPTIHLNDLDQQARDKKVKELYPQFEKNIKKIFLNMAAHSRA